MTRKIWWASAAVLGLADLEFLAQQQDQSAAQIRVVINDHDTGGEIHIVHDGVHGSRLPARRVEPVSPVRHGLRQRDEPEIFAQQSRGSAGRANALPSMP